MSEVDELKERIAKLESELHGQIARTNAAIAAAQERTYWLDRLHVDLNAIMKTRTGQASFAALRLARTVFRGGRLVAGAAGEAARRWQVVAKEARARSSDASPAAPSQLQGAPSHAPPMEGIVTDRLYARLRHEDMEAIDQRLKAPDAARWIAAEGLERRRLALAFASEQEGSESHGESVAAAASYYYADLVANTLTTVALNLDRPLRVAYLGPSPDRVTKLLTSALPDVSWDGCESEGPPLQYADGVLDAAVAVSLWSHLSQRASAAWLDEMKRVLRPAGLLVLTAQGESSIAHAAQNMLRPPAQLQEIRTALYRWGYWFGIEPGTDDGRVVQSLDRGTMFMSSEWLLGSVTPDWGVALVRPGMVEQNQDLYVLRRP